MQFKWEMWKQSESSSIGFCSFLLLKKARLKLFFLTFSISVLNKDDAWLDDAVPLQRHSKTRRSDTSLFRFNPVKSHFRRLRSSGIGHNMNYNDGFSFNSGRFGAFYPPAADSMLIRKRRSFKPAESFAM
jgi:hypothetical protein